MAELPELGNAEFAFFQKLIHDRAGIALGSCKRSLLASRLTRRLRALGLRSFEEYRRCLQTPDLSNGELGLMINCITTNKTSFFREPEHFEILSASIRAAARAGIQKVFRIWSAACSTGEEAYSIAMTALDSNSGLDVRVLASDIDTEVLAQASEGIYPIDSIDDLDGPTKRRHFLRGCGEHSGWVQVKPAVRDMVAFRHINLVEEPWPVQTSFDAIFCRNVIIYFDRSTQSRLFTRLTELLTPEGRLYTGHAEALYWLNDLLVPIDHSVYRAAVPAGPETVKR